jgi:hypothetical protein
LNKVENTTYNITLKLLFLKLSLVESQYNVQTIP